MLTETACSDWTYRDAVITFVACERSGRGRPFRRRRTSCRTPRSGSGRVDDFAGCLSREHHHPVAKSGRFWTLRRAESAFVVESTVPDEPLRPPTDDEAPFLVGTALICGVHIRAIRSPRNCSK
ncbi:hypothetical protein HSRCO_1733 [Halanaeroarchaeum sp. HSR-CO]|nr:hypothetical protein HSRCO_1733 [Halanaeroarchaeum sp. HSR-CO]